MKRRRRSRRQWIAIAVSTFVGRPSSALLAWSFSPKGTASWPKQLLVRGCRTQSRQLPIPRLLHSLVRTDTLLYMQPVSTPETSSGYTNGERTNSTLHDFDAANHHASISDAPNATSSTSSITSFKEMVSNFLSQPVVEVINGFFVLLSSLLVAISTLDNLSPRIADPIQIAQDWIAGMFVVEFVLRWLVTASSPLRYFAQPLVLVDVFVVFVPFLVSIAPKFLDPHLPSWLTSSSSLINLRLLRILRLQRVLVDQETFARFERALGIPSSDIKGWQLQLARVVLSIFTLLSVATGLIYTAEHKVNPGITDYFSALYFGLTTLTTVGFGEIYPMTWQGRLVVCGSILAGVAVIPAQGAALVEALLERARENNNKNLLLLDNASATAAPVSPVSPPQPPGTSPPQPHQSMSSTSTPSSTQMILETALPCPTCKAVLHWSTARYCWSCGSPLSPSNPDRPKFGPNQ